MKTITESDWLATWDQERRNAAVKPPTGFYSAAQIAARLGLPISVVRDRMRREMAAGQVEHGRFLVLDAAGRTVLVSHFRRIAAPSATKSKALKSRTGQNGSGARRARK